MSDCEVTRRALLAYGDGELVEEEQGAVEAHLRSCAACRHAYANESSLVGAIRKALPRPAAPEGLRQRVERIAVADVGAPRRGGSMAALAAGVALLAVAVSSRAPSRPANERPEFVSVAVDSHLRFAAGRLPLEVRSQKAEEVSAFFSGRVPFHLTLPDYPIGPGEQKFYDLEGGRLVALTGDYAAYVAYRMDGRPISLLVASADRVRPYGRQAVRSGSLTFHLDAVAGLNVITWVDNGLTYALVSDLSISATRQGESPSE